MNCFLFNELLYTTYISYHTSNLHVLPKSLIHCFRFIQKTTPAMHVPHRGDNRTQAAAKKTVDGATGAISMVSKGTEEIKTRITGTLVRYIFFVLAGSFIGFSRVRLVPVCSWQINFLYAVAKKQTFQGKGGRVIRPNFWRSRLTGLLEFVVQIPCSRGG